VNGWLAKGIDSPGWGRPPRDAAGKGLGFFASDWKQHARGNQLTRRISSLELPRSDRWLLEVSPHLRRFFVALAVVQLLLLLPFLQLSFLAR
jgi:hypothetical protein